MTENEQRHTKQERPGHTERRDALCASRRNQDAVTAALIQVVDGLPDAILLLDERWKLIYANRTAHRVSRIQVENVERDTLWELFPEIVGTPLERAYRESMELGEERHVDAFYYEPFKTWFAISILPGLRGLVVYYRDVTAATEAEIARAQVAERLQQVHEATTDGIVSLDAQWRITYLNERAKQVLARQGDILGTNMWESFPAALYENSPYVENYHRAMKERVTVEFEAYYPEPLNIWVKVLVRPSRDGIILFFRDVTQEKLAEAALIQSEKLAAVGRLASSIAHEINNPLEAVTNLLYLARRTSHSAEVEQYMDTAEQELQRVAHIVNQTLRFHKQATRPQAIGCNELFSTVLSIYEGRLRNSGIAVERRKRAQEGVVCFEGEIRQVLNNFVGNSIDAMPQGGRLVIRSREGTDWRTGRRGLVLTVADDGCGINPEDQARMFEAFFTTKGFGGTGLGLWISAEIVTRHRGRILIRSSQRQNCSGTVVALFLPFKTEPVASSLLPVQRFLAS